MVADGADITQALLTLCVSPSPGKAFFRPFLCNGDFSKVKAFIVGYNPATPLFPNEDLTLSEYVAKLQNYDVFIKYLQEYRFRESAGKTRLSRTRPSIIWCREWMEQITGGSVLETNVNAYPTPKAKLLKKEPYEIIEKGRAIFVHNLKHFAPKLLVIHGLETLKEFIGVVFRNGMIKGLPMLPKEISEIQKSGVTFTLNYDNGDIGKVFAGRHLWQRNMYKGEFDQFKSMIENQLS